MSTGVLVGGKGRVTVGMLLDTSDEEPTLRVLINDAGRGTSEEAALELAAAAQILSWLAQVLREPRAM